MAEITTELFIGQGKQTNTTYWTEIQSSKKIIDEYPTKLSELKGIRLGKSFTKWLSIELSKQWHGEYKINTPVILNNSMFTHKATISTQSIKLGVKLKQELFKSTNVNFRLGLAKWKRTGLFWSPNYNASPLLNKDGTDIYYSIGSDYKITRNIFVGVEYSRLTLTYKKHLKEQSRIDSIKNDHDINEMSLSFGWLF